MKSRLLTSFFTVLEFIGRYVRQTGPKMEKRFAIAYPNFEGMLCGLSLTLDTSEKQLALLLSCHSSGYYISDTPTRHIVEHFNSWTEIEPFQKRKKSIKRRKREAGGNMITWSESNNDSV